MEIHESREVKVEYDVDIIVAGAGVAGVFAALAAAGLGRETLLIERFGSPGGNIGPGMIAGGSLSGYPIPHMYRGPFFGLPKKFIERHAVLGGGSVPPYKSNHYPRDSQVATHVFLEMLEEAGVRCLFSTYACDPILDGGRVAGLFMENKSGRIAATGKVTIDATGEADISRRAGAPVIMPEAYYHSIDGHAPTGMGIYFVLGGVRWEEYERFRWEAREAKEEDVAWAGEVLGRTPPPHLISSYRRAWEEGSFKVVHELNGLGGIGFQREFKVLSREDGLAGAMLNLKTPWIAEEAMGKVDAGDGGMVSDLERGLRMYIFRLAAFWREYVPGFEESYLSCIAPYLGSRGGPCVEGDYVLTHPDVAAGRRFPDVLYIFDHVGDLAGSAYKGNWTDFPYRVMLPKGLEGVLAVGRSASSRPDTLIRSRSMVMHMGEAGGTAAALAVEHGTTPRGLDTSKLQKAMLEAGYNLGDRERLAELGL